MASPYDPTLLLLHVLKQGRIKYQDALTSFSWQLTGPPHLAGQTFSALVTRLVSQGLVAYSTGQPAGTIPPPPIQELWLTELGKRAAELGPLQR